MNITTVGIDLAKNVFQVHAADVNGVKVFSKTVKRTDLAALVMKLPKCLIGMEACGGAHHWAREFEKLGHEVKLMNPQYVKPYVKTNKNDRNDAEAICEAVTRPNMRFVPVKTIEQQDMQLFHTVRSRLIASRIALSNQVRGVLAERGIAICKGHSAFVKMLDQFLKEGNKNFPAKTITVIQELYQEYTNLEKQIAVYNKRIEEAAAKSKEAQRLMSIPGVGEIIATAVLSHVGDAKVFKKGKDLSSFLGLVPKQTGSGGKTKLHGISKRGNRYIRALLIHGARSVVLSVKRKPEKAKNSAYFSWIQDMLMRLPYNKVVVAVANKNSRTIWALQSKGQMFVA